MVYREITDKKRQGARQLAILIDPDKLGHDQLLEQLAMIREVQADYVFIGGSLMVTDRLDEYLKIIRAQVEVPVVIFPGSPMQVNAGADAILLLSLISGRNAELLIGHHVVAAPYLKASGLEVLPTGYILVDGGRPTTASYMSHTNPVPSDKKDVAACTALAGEMLGLRMIYLDAGSGAVHPVPPAMIRAVQAQVQVPVIVGGGITNAEKARQAYDAGADVLVVGTAAEKDVQVIREIGASRFPEPWKS